MRCFWCNTDPEEAAARHEGPHATWCVYFPKTYEQVVADFKAAGQSHVRDHLAQQEARRRK